MARREWERDTQALTRRTEKQMVGRDPLSVTEPGTTRARLNALVLVAVVALTGCGGGSEAPEATSGEGAETAAPAEQSGDMLIVSGASGELGGLVVQELLERGVAP